MFKKTKPYTLLEATKKLERYCAYQERCHKEVLLKLKAMHMIPDAIDQIMGHLIQQNYLNEERFSQCFARGKFKIKNWGRNRIINELKLRDISKYNIASALEEIDDETYFEAFDLLSKKKWDNLQEIDIEKRKRKLINFLLYRGWESHLVYGKVKELAKL